MILPSGTVVTACLEVSDFIMEPESMVLLVSTGTMADGAFGAFGGAALEKRRMAFERVFIADFMERKVFVSTILQPSDHHQIFGLQSVKVEIPSSEIIMLKLDRLIIADLQLIVAHVLCF